MVFISDKSYLPVDGNPTTAVKIFNHTYNGKNKDSARYRELYPGCNVPLFDLQGVPRHE